MKTHAIALWVVLAAGFQLQATVIVLSNNSPLDDFFTNSGSSNQGQAVGTSGWYYNNVRNGGGVGISSIVPWNVTGSAYFSSPSASAKADIEYLANAVNIGGNYFATGVLGSFANLQSLSYRWYRIGTSTAPTHLHPVIRILLDADGDLSTITDRGGLVYERVYMGLPVPTNQWVNDLITASSFLWNFGLGLGFAANINNTPYAYDATLAQWQAYFPNAVILGFSLGVGSGWQGTFLGAVDDVSWNIAGVSSNTNFEVSEVPEPGLGWLVGAAVLVICRRRRQS
jgi:hypothetical protein